MKRSFIGAGVAAERCSAPKLQRAGVAAERCSASAPARMLVTDARDSDYYREG